MPASSPHTRSTTLLQHFAAQVQHTPHTTAVQDGARELSYLELNCHANQLAWHLQQTTAVRPGSIVGVCLPRCADLIIALLAVLKCGAAYLPLDPRWPCAEKAFQLDDARACAIITHQEYQAGLPDHVTAISLDTARTQIALQPTEPPELPVDALAEQLCYVMYTSGSTGKPKGVLIPHRGVLRLVCQPNYVDVHAADRIAAASNPVFDASTFEIWGALLNGACLVILPEDLLLDFQQLAVFLRHERITTLFVTTQLFNHVSRAAPHTFASVQTLLFGGEAVDPTSVRTILSAGRPRRLLNMYGPTECTTFATWYEIEDVEESATTIPIGYPINQTSVLVLDDQMQSVGPGTVGELYIGGDGVACGYLQREALTRERFLDHPHYGRLYRTGDLVYRRADGALVFAGRTDTQVKLNGFRVEPAEIEAVLRTYPAVVDAAVVVREENPDDRQLVAYMIATRQLSHQELSTFLKERLRAYLIPRRLVQIDALPQTKSGAKVDRKALALAPLGSRGTVLRDEGPEAKPSLHPLETLVLAAYRAVKGHDLTPGAALNDLDSLACAELASHLADGSGVPPAVLLSLLTTQPTATALCQMLEAAKLTLRVTQEWGKQERNIAAEQQPKATAPLGDPTTAMRLSQPEKSPLPAFVRREPRPLLDLVRSGLLPPVDAAALSYLPALPHAPHRLASWQQWSDNQPVFTHIVHTAHGRIGLFALPLDASALYTERDRVLELSLLALHQARAAGARVVALTGLLPSALRYGEMLIRALGDHADLPRITTGHATTTSAVVMNIDRLVHHEAGRDLAHETVAFLGLGSIGQATLRLMLRVLPHPKTLLLCDLHAHQLTHLAAQVTAEGYRGKVVVLPASGGQLPEAISRATTIVGATNIPNVLDIWRLSPGTLLIDDSGPHCFAAAEAIARMQRCGDVLAIEAGEFRMPSPAQELRCHPAGPPVLAELLETEEMLALRTDPFEIMGCLNSGLLSAAWQLPTTLGLVDPTIGAIHYQAMQAHGFTAACPHLEQFMLPHSLLSEFRARFGSTQASSPQLADSKSTL
jgi:amino acid adenylation domain-containing protein